MRIYRTQEFAKLLGVSADTLRRWDKQGKLRAGRMPGGSWYYTDGHLERALEDGGDGRRESD